MSNIQDPKQRETMMDDFKKSFKPKPKKKIEKAVPEKPAGSGEGSVPAAELEGDLRSLISRLIDPKVNKNIDLIEIIFLFGLANTINDY